MVMYSTVATIGVQGAVRRESQWLVWGLCCRSLETAEGSLTPSLKKELARALIMVMGAATHNRSKEKMEYCSTETFGGFCRRRLLDDLGGCKSGADLSNTLSRGHQAWSRGRR